MRMLFWVLLIMLFCSVGSVSAADLSRKDVAAPGEIPGVFTLILAGATYDNDPERVAILDLEGDGYSFQPVMTDYRVKKVAGLTAVAALPLAEKYFSLHCAYNGYRLKGLALPDGRIVGYELIPDLPAALCGYGNVVTVGYRLGDDGVIKVYTGVAFSSGLDLSGMGGNGRGR